MSSIKEKVAVGLGVFGLATGALWYLDPARPNVSLEEHQRQVQEQRMADLNKANERSRSRYRDELRDHIDSENRRDSGSSEQRPRPRVRLRL